RGAAGDGRRGAGPTRQVLRRIRRGLDVRRERRLDGRQDRNGAAVRRAGAAFVVHWLRAGGGGSHACHRGGRDRGKRRRGFGEGRPHRRAGDGGVAQVAGRELLRRNSI